MTVIGRCAGCERRAVLRELSCSSCSEKFGPKFGMMASRIRVDPDFKKKCYGSLKTEISRMEFVNMFGRVG